MSNSSPVFKLSPRLRFCAIFDASPKLTMLSTAKSLTEEPKSIMPERKKERARIPSASPNSGIEMMSEFSEDGSERVAFAGNGSR